MGKYRGLNITGGLNANFRKIKVRKTVDTESLEDRGTIAEAASDLPTKGAGHRRGRGALKSQRKAAQGATRGSISMGWIVGDDSNVIGTHDYGYIFQNTLSNDQAAWETRRALGVAASIAEGSSSTAAAPVYATGVSLYNSTGIIPAGTPLILNGDGTVSAVQTVPGSNEAGTVADYMNDTLSYPQVVYDAVSSKAVFIYVRNKNSYARVASIAADGTITYGSETLVESGNGTYGPIELSATMAGSSVVIASRGLHGSNNPRLIAGTISGTSISFGSYTTIYTTNGQASSPTVSWDSVHNKGLLTYSCSNLEGVFFTVSGTSVSAGSATEILHPDYGLYNYGMRSIYHAESGYFSVFWTGRGNTYNTESPYRTYSTTIDPTQSVPSSVNLAYSGLVTGSDKPALSYDTSTGKIVLLSNYSKEYVVASIDSNGTVTYGSTGVVSGITDNANVSNLTQSTMTYDPVSNLHIAEVRYNDGSVQTRKHLVGTLSGDTVSWELSDSSSPVDSYFRESTYDSTNNKVIFHYTVNSSTETQRGGGYVLGAGAASSNLTDSNFIGFAKDGFTSAGQLGKVVSGGGVVAGFTGLIAGNDYYVQPDGSISEVSTAPAVLAGTALSDTTLQVAAMSPSYSYTSANAVSGTVATSLTNTFSGAAAITLDGNTVAIGYGVTNTANEYNGKVVIHTKQNGVWVETQVINCPTNTSNWNLYHAGFGDTIKFTDDGTRMLVDAPGYGTWENNYGGFFIFDKNETTGLFEETQRIFNQQDFYISNERGSKMDRNRVDMSSDGSLIAVQQMGTTGHYNSESKKSYILIYRKTEDGTYSYVNNHLITDQSYYDGTHRRNIALSDNGHIVLGDDDSGTANVGTHGGAEHVYYDIENNTFVSQILYPTLDVPHSGYNGLRDYGEDVAITQDGEIIGVYDAGFAHQAVEDGSQQSTAIFVFKHNGDNTYSQVQRIEHPNGLGEQTQSLQFNRDGSQLYAVSSSKLTVFNWDNETNTYVEDSTTDGYSTYRNRFWMSRDGAHMLMVNGTTFNTYSGTA